MKPLIYSSIMMSFSMGYIFVDFPIYLSEVGYSSYLIGIILSIPTFVGALLMIPFGSFSDRYGRKKFILIARASSVISMMIYILTFSLYYILIASILQGFAFANASSSFQALMTEKTDKKNRNFVFSFNSFSSGLSQAGGMIFGSIPYYLTEYFNLGIFDSYRILFGVSLLLNLLSTLIIINIEENYVPSKKSEKINMKEFSVVWKFSVLGLIGLGAGVIVRLFPYWFYVKYGINVNVLGPIYAISMIVTSIASLYSANIASKIGEVKTIFLTQIISILVLISIPLMPLYSLAAILFILRNALMNMGGPIQSSLIMSLIPEKNRALGSSVIQFFDAIPRSIGPALGGYLMQMNMIDMPFYVTGMLYTASTVGFYVMFKNIKIIK
ncbi:MAG: MFS transporter [Thermoplasmata archaeon]